LERKTSKDSAASVAEVEGFHLGWEPESVNPLGWESMMPQEEESAALEPPTAPEEPAEENCTDHAAGMTDRVAELEFPEKGTSAAFDAALLPPLPAVELESAAIASALNLPKESKSALYYQSGDEESIPSHSRSTSKNSIW
jgi:hypothetical protein